MAHDYRKADVSIARHFLARTGIIGEPHWHLAANGDSAVSIGVALRVQKKSGCTLLMDVAMTAVLCVALEGDGSAALLIAAILRQDIEAVPKAEPISDSWLMHSIKRCQSKSAAEEHRS